MASVINTNIASLNTQRNLGASQAGLNTSIQRLSSGMRINSSKDDAAGLAIATRMDSQLRGMNVAIRNSNDAISFAQTAEGGLSKVTDALQRMRELAVQSANETNTADDRVNLNAEFKQLQAEITRISENTKFNGTNTLSGGVKTYQVGSNAGDTIAVTGTDITAATSKCPCKYCCRSNCCNCRNCCCFCFNCCYCS
jgi:flagellin